jgi:hypothetical protein
MSIIRTLLLLICVLLTASDGICSTVARTNFKYKKGHETEIKYVTVKYFHELDFKTIPEYFGQKQEYQYFRCITRDDTAKREGTYFIVGLNKPIEKLPANVWAKIYILTSIEEGTNVYRCEIPNRRCCAISEIYCGITSKPVDASKINAWKVELLDSDNNVLSSKKSYMWQQESSPQ